MGISTFVQTAHDSELCELQTVDFDSWDERLREVIE